MPTSSPTSTVHARLDTFASRAPSRRLREVTRVTRVQQVTTALLCRAILAQSWLCLATLAPTQMWSDFRHASNAQLVNFAVGEVSLTARLAFKDTTARSAQKHLFPALSVLTVLQRVLLCRLNASPARKVSSVISPAVSSPQETAFQALFAAAALPCQLRSRLSTSQTISIRRMVSALVDITVLAQSVMSCLCRALRVPMAPLRASQSALLAILAATARPSA